MRRIFNFLDEDIFKLFMQILQLDDILNTIEIKTNTLKCLSLITLGSVKSEYKLD